MPGILKHLDFEGARLCDAIASYGRKHVRIPSHFIIRLKNRDNGSMEKSSMENLPLEISVEEVKQLMDEGESFFLVDCREPSEHAHCQIESATLIPMNETPEKVETFREQKGRVVVFCHHGGRSLYVTQYLRGQGIECVQSMAGGIDRWSVVVDPEISRY